MNKEVSIKSGEVRKEILAKLNLNEHQIVKCAFNKPKSDKGL